MSQASPHEGAPPAAHGTQTCEHVCSLPFFFDLSSVAAPPGDELSGRDESESSEE